jgi:uncharacterized protein
VRVLISGGSGLIGRALSRRLVERGDEVVILSRHPRRIRNLPAGIRAVRWDGHTGNGWFHEIIQDSAIVNLAGENLLQWRWTEERRRRILDSRVNAGKAVVDAVQRTRYRPTVVIQASGVNYYGTDSPEPSTECSPPGDDFLARVCVAWEASTVAVEELGVRRSIIRSGVILSRDSPALRLLALPFRFFVGGKIGSGRQVLNWIHRDDHVSAVLHLLDQPDAVGPYNLNAPIATTNAEFSSALGRVLRRPALIPAPALALRLALGEMAMAMVVEGQFARPQRLVDRGFTFDYPEIEGALRDALDRRQG